MSGDEKTTAVAMTGDAMNKLGLARPVTPDGDPDAILKGASQGVIDVTMPDLVPAENVVDIEDLSMKRVRVPVRIRRLEINELANGFKVTISNAGYQNMWGPDGSEHVFLDMPSMLEFVGTVLGQVAYQYREVEVEMNTAGIAADGR